MCVLAWGGVCINIIHCKHCGFVPNHMSRSTRSWILCCLEPRTADDWVWDSAGLCCLWSAGYEHTPPSTAHPIHIT